MTHVLLTNGRQDYLALGAPNASNYHGYFIRDGNGYVKVLWNILPEGDLREATVGPTVSRRFERAYQRLTLADEGVLAYCEGTFVLTLDCKRRHDESEDGREYVVERRKAPSRKTDRTLGSVEQIHVHYPKEGLHVVIATTMPSEPVGTWREVRYPYDERRGTRSTRWVYDLLGLSGRGYLSVAAGYDRKRAEQDAFSLLLRHGELSGETYGTPAEQAEHALRSLCTPAGVMAGLPWFHREWSRDELIACGGLLALGEREHVVSILDKWYGTVREDGRLPAIHPDEGLASMDAPGWLARRTLDVLGDVPDDKLDGWIDALDTILTGLPVRDGLVWTDTNETWMDTARDDDGRAGARIEIQALAMTLCDAHAALCERAGREPKWHDLREEIASAVRERLVDGVILDGLARDGRPDRAVRPNVFLAWYVQPDLFAGEEWRKTFGHALDHLWLEWGGLASISTEDSRFHPADTGEDSGAYHRGDSWYFVNNIAAMALSAVGGFDERVDKLREASVRDLRQGFVGHASEISSAEEQEPMGCWAQAWSASTFLELTR